MLIYDSHLSAITLRLKARSNVSNIACGRRRIAVASERRVDVYTLDSLPHLIVSIEQPSILLNSPPIETPLALLDADCGLVATPAESRGVLGLTSLPTTTSDKTRLVRAHRHSLQIIALSRHGE